MVCFRTACRIALSPDFKDRPKNICPFCDKQLSRNSELNIHIKVGYSGHAPFIFNLFTKHGTVNIFPTKCFRYANLYDPLIASTRWQMCYIVAVRVGVNVIDAIKINGEVID